MQRLVNVTLHKSNEMFVLETWYIYSPRLYNVSNDSFVVNSRPWKASTICSNACFDKPFYNIIYWCIFIPKYLTIFFSFASFRWRHFLPKWPGASQSPLHCCKSNWCLTCTFQCLFLELVMFLSSSCCASRPIASVCLV